VLLDPAVGRVHKVRATNPERARKQPCVYVGMTGLTPEERFANHKAGTLAAWVVKRCGLRLLPERGASRARCSVPYGFYLMSFSFNPQSFGEGKSGSLIQPHTLAVKSPIRNHWPVRGSNQSAL
jgi:hypothetical protein